VLRSPEREAVRVEGVVRHHSCFNLKLQILEMLSASFIEIAPEEKSFMALDWMDFMAFFFWVLVL